MLPGVLPGWSHRKRESFGRYWEIADIDWDCRRLIKTPNRISERPLRGGLLHRVTRLLVPITMPVSSAGSTSKPRRSNGAGSLLCVGDAGAGVLFCMSCIRRRRRLHQNGERANKGLTRAADAFSGLSRTRARTWDPLIKSQRLKMLGIGPNQQ